jgi:hypothetical protein
MLTIRRFLSCTAWHDELAGSPPAERSAPSVAASVSTLAFTGAVVAAARLLLALHIQTTFPGEADLPLQHHDDPTAICMFGLALALVFWQFENGTSHLKNWPIWMD